MQKKKIKSSARLIKAKQVERKITGHKVQAQGLRFEQKAVEYLSTQEGWQNIQLRAHKYGYEWDLLANKEDSWSGTTYLVVECKDKACVSAHDVLRFYNKVSVYYEKLPIIMFEKPVLKAYLCYSGEVDQEAKLI